MTSSARYWNGWTYRDGNHVLGDIRRSHGNWLAIVRFKDGKGRKGELFEYGRPGSLLAAKQWVEENAR